MLALKAMELRHCPRGYACCSWRDAFRNTIYSKRARARPPKSSISHSGPLGGSRPAIALHPAFPRSDDRFFYIRRHSEKLALAWRVWRQRRKGSRTDLDPIAGISRFPRRRVFHLWHGTLSGGLVPAVVRGYWHVHPDRRPGASRGVCPRRKSSFPAGGALSFS